MKIKYSDNELFSTGIRYCSQIYMTDKEIENQIKKMGGNLGYEQLVILSELNGVKLELMCSHLNIPVPEKPSKKICSDYRIKTMYEKGYSDVEIATVLGYNRQQILYWRKSQNLKSNHPNKSHKKML